jgi:MFS family permease
MHPRLSRPTAFYLLASIILFFLAGSSAPSPLYGVYQAAWGFSPVTITVVFGIYAVAVLTTLLVMGSLSDHIGRRPVLVATILVQAGAMLLFAAAGSVRALILARVVQGLATGAAAGAIGAGLLDLDKTKGTVANAVAPLLGTALGGFVSGVMAQYLPAPTQLVYLAFAAIFVLQAIGVVFIPETATRRPGAWRSLRPHLHLPENVRSAALFAAPALIATWSLAGFYGSLGPSLARKLVGSGSLLLGGVLLLLVAGSGALMVFFTRALSARAVLVAGTGALIVGVAITLVGMVAGSGAAAVILFFTGAAIAGAGFGAGFQGAIRTVLPLAAPTERAGVLSVLYVIAYLSMGGPAVLAGVRVVHGGGLFGSARDYGIGVIALAIAALAGTLTRRRSTAATTAASPRTASAVLPFGRG